jgi:hypothetical protein
MKHMLELAMFFGLGAVAVWTYVRFPRLRPGSLVLAALHVAVSFLVFALLPDLLGLVLPLMPTHAQAEYASLALLIPIFTYLLLSWLWLIARILSDLHGGPRGGHPADARH